MKKLMILFSLAFAASAFAQKFENLALTPQMGWNSWNKFACNINEKLIRETADAMVATGLKDAGYIYINLDDCWHGERDSMGFIHENKERFPSGIKALADYVHSKGLKLGIYSDAGNKTCGGKPASRGHEYQDAYTFAKWGIDYLKYDWCDTEGLNAKGAYTTMRDALYWAGRPVLFSMCEWGTAKPWTWAKDIAHSWRTTGDITNHFEKDVDHGTWKSLSVMTILDLQDGLRQYAGPGHWNDPDMMEVGNGMSLSEDRAHFSMWCMLAAPLIMGNDLRSMPKEILDILTNKEVIAVNQDSLGIQALRHEKTDSLEVWYKPLKGGDWAVCFLNRASKPYELNYNWSGKTITDDVAGLTLKFEGKPLTLRNLWTKKDSGTTAKILKATVPPHDVLMFRLRKPI